MKNDVSENQKQTSALAEVCGKEDLWSKFRLFDLFRTYNYIYSLSVLLGSDVHTSHNYVLCKKNFFDYHILLIHMMSMWRLFALGRLHR